VYHEQNQMRDYRLHRRSDVLTIGVQFHLWKSGFRQFSFNPIAQLLQSHGRNIFNLFLLYNRIVVPPAVSGLGMLFAPESSTLNSDQFN
jgi:hypothetical protein